MRSRSKHEASVHFRPLKSESRKRLSDRQVRSGLDSNLTTQCDVPFTPMLSIHKTNQPPPTATPCRRHHLNRELPDRVMQPTPPLSLYSSLAAAPRFRFSLFPDPKSPKSSVHNFRGKKHTGLFLSFFLFTANRNSGGKERLWHRVPDTLFSSIGPRTPSSPTP